MHTPTFVLWQIRQHALGLKGSQLLINRSRYSRNLIWYLSLRIRHNSIQNRERNRVKHGGGANLSDGARDEAASVDTLKKLRKDEGNVKHKCLVSVKPDISRDVIISHDEDEKGQEDAEGEEWYAPVDRIKRKQRTKKEGAQKRYLGEDVLAERQRV